MNRKERRRLKKQAEQSGQGMPAAAPMSPEAGPQGLSSALFNYASGGNLNVAEVIPLEHGLPNCVQLIEQERYQEAESLCTQLRGANPSQIDVLYLSGLVSSRLDRPEKAEQFLRMALAIDDEHANAAILLGDLLELRDDLDGAIDAYEMAAEAAPESSEPHYRLGYVHQKKRAHDAAVQAYQMSLKINPDQAEVCLNMGYAYFSAGAVNDAIESYQRAIALNPVAAQPHINLGAAHAHLDQLEPAAASFRTGLNFAPDNAEGLFGLASVLRQLETHGEAAEYYRRGFKVDPERGNAYWEMGYSLEMSGDKSGAESAYRQCLEREPDHGVAKHLLSALIGDTTQAAPQDYVEDLFDDYAETFDQVLVEQLDYAVPGLINEKLATLAPTGAPAYPRVLDLGGGTGLVAAAIKAFAGDIDGVDLSAKMLQVAKREGRYSRTFVMDILEFLDQPHLAERRYDLVVSGDVFVYLGDLRALFDGAANRLEQGGVFLFSVEHLDDEGEGGDEPYVIRPTGRYAHRESYIRDLAAPGGFEIRSIDYIDARKDGTETINGMLCCLIRI